MSAARGGSHLLVSGVQGLPRSPGSCALHPLWGAQDQLFLLLDQLFKLCPLWGPAGRRPHRRDSADCSHVQGAALTKIGLGTSFSHVSDKG